MNQKKLSILFYLNRAKTNQKGICPIYCRLTYLKKRKQFSTGEFIKPKDWNTNQKKAASGSSKLQQINIQLTIISTSIKQAYLQLQLNTIKFTVEEIFSTYLGEPSKDKVNVIACFKKFLDEREKLIGIEIKHTTWKKFRDVCNQVQEFTKWKYSKNDLPICRLQLSFLTDLEFYLKSERKQSQITANKTIQRFRKPINEAVTNGILDNDPFAQYKPKSVRTQVIFLSKEELKSLENYHFTQPRLQVVQDLFTFCCYTGLAYREMSNLKKEHIIMGFDGNDWISMKREKTGKMISIPLLPKANKILNKYETSDDFVLPKISNQKINSYLKEIAEIVGIKKSITHHMARKTFASTILLFNDVPIEIVSELLGHSSIKITQDYYGKIVQKRVSEEITRLSVKFNFTSDN